MCESVFSGDHFHSYIGEMLGDLHSMDYFSGHTDRHGSSLCLDINDLHILNTNISHCMEINNSQPFYDQPLMGLDQSSGYLEDALFEFRSKRRRLVLTPDDHRHHYQRSDQINTPPPSFPNYWDFTDAQDFENFVSGDNSTSSSQSKSSINIQFFSDKEALSSPDHVTGGIKEVDKRKVITRVVYPFALVKPGGFKGDMTLNDINERILMPPTRPVRHPVGDFACRPLVSVDKPGLSGKIVVALTRIQTHGRGTITIIRTKN